MGTGATAPLIVHHTVCPLCNGPNMQAAFECHDYLLSHERFVIMQCASCSFLFTQDAPDESTIQTYYKSEHYIPHETIHHGIGGKLMHMARKQLRLPKKIRLVRRFSQKQTGGNILDIGCGNGEFALAMKKEGWNMAAIEPSSRMREHCIAQGIDCKNNAVLADLPTQSFDAIILWHVLEHVHNLHGMMKDIQRLLAFNGTALVAVPNIGGPLMRFYGTHDVPRHLWHFTPETFARLSAMHGLNIISTSALHLDSLYMGLYYERMSGGYAIRGLLLGLIDMIYGMVKPNNAASLIYVLKRNNITQA